MEKDTKILSLVLSIMLFALSACSAVNPAKKAVEATERSCVAAIFSGGRSRSHTPSTAGQ